MRPEAGRRLICLRNHRSGISLSTLVTGLAAAGLIAVICHRRILLPSWEPPELARGSPPAPPGKPLAERGFPRVTFGPVSGTMPGPLDGCPQPAILALELSDGLTAVCPCLIFPGNGSGCVRPPFWPRGREPWVASRNRNGVVIISR